MDPTSAKINGSFPLAIEEAVTGPHYTPQYLLAAVHNAEFSLQKTLMFFPLQIKRTLSFSPLLPSNRFSKIPLPEKGERRRKPAEESMTKEENSSDEMNQNFKPTGSAVTSCQRSCYCHDRQFGNIILPIHRKLIWERGRTLFRVIFHKFFSLIFASALGLW